MKYYCFSLLLCCIFLTSTLSGQFGPPQVMLDGIIEPEGATDVIAADVDGDGDMDVLFASTGIDRIAWFENYGDGTFSDFIPIDTNNFTSVYAADLDNDEDIDVLSSGRLNGKVKWYENDGTGNFIQSTTITSNASNVQWVHADDLDGDGDIDVLSASVTDDKIAWYENLGEGEFSGEIVLTNSANAARMVQTADLDGDEDIDVLFASSLDSKIGWFENLGDGQFSSEAIITTDASSPFAIYPADLENDGLIDIISASTLDDQIAWVPNLGDGLFGDIETISDQVEEPEAVFAADLDNDGDQDVLSASYDDLKVAWYENDGFGNFGPQIILSNLEPGANAVYAADLDNDGDNDVLSASWNNDRIVWYENLVNRPKIFGQTYWDYNENGALDDGEPGLYLQQVSLVPSPIITQQTDIGNYLFAVEEGTYLVNCQPFEGWTTTINPTQTVSANSTFNELNFGLKPVSTFPAASLSVTSGPTRCGFEVPFWINYQNTGTQSANGTITLILDSLVSFEFAHPFPTSIDGQTISWDFEDLPPTHPGTIEISLTMPDVESIGETVSFDAQVMLQDEDGADIFDNSTSYSSLITCAYDPNDKQLDPLMSYNNTNYSLLEDSMIYTIRFQNTGIDTAFTVRLEDTFNPNIDVSTFKPLSASHSYEWEMDESRKLTVTFNNILLPPDYENYTGSQGFFKFQIDHNEGLPHNTPLENRAFIYFDFNPPIITNFVFNLLVDSYPVFASIDEPSCSDSNNGSIAINFPLGDFTYEWDNGSNGTSVDSLGDDTYSVTITRSDDRIVGGRNFLMNPPDELILSASSTVSTNGEANGSASVNVQGGTPPYSFLWDTDPPQQSATIDSLLPGSYKVIVTDDQGCIREAIVLVDQVTKVNEVQGGTGFKLYPNPARAQARVEVLLSNQSQWELTCFSADGKQLQQYHYADTQRVIQFDELKPGMYYLSLRTEDKVYIQKLSVIR